jgi:type II secretory pathway component PulF
LNNNLADVSPAVEGVLNLADFFRDNWAFLLLLALIGFGLIYFLTRYAKGEVSEEAVTQEIIGQVQAEGVTDVETSNIVTYLHDVLHDKELLEALRAA